MMKKSLTEISLSQNPFLILETKKHQLKYIWIVLKKSLKLKFRKTNRAILVAESRVHFIIWKMTKASLWKLFSEIGMILLKRLRNNLEINTTWKVSKYRFFSGLNFLQSDQKKLGIWTLFTQWKIFMRRCVMILDLL